MLRKLDESLAEYQKLSDLATGAYRLATDLGDWYQWTTVRHSFEEEAAFYHEQAKMRERGAEVVYLGLDGPLSDATNAFHWTLEALRTQAGWSSQSYALGAHPFARARLAMAYDMSSPACGEELKAWVRSGGKLVVFDSTGRAGRHELLDGIQFSADAS